MAESTIHIDLVVGAYTLVELEIEVQWSLNTIGEIDIDDFYAYYVSTDDTGHKSFERIPYWMHKIVEVELEEYHEDIVNKMD
jgi:hypothetical protein